ncbi:conserved hypothetical protein [Rippkaea orientalis PCC 8801]|uniref:Uncharacterized protein n=1 Tax=Rippkaea orientalis (strain PCC 8801 / RF-1) TaxID=41431 RepID=B7JXC0_RIPO1|nr:type IV pilus biogenesis protein EbsA [Rippkaea orientalis]ACK67108.1 conserved hypothetical protein [Rippkaea orientalis PCC 8801]
MSTIEQLEPAEKGKVIIYQPYCPKDKHKILPYALSLYKQGSLEGERQIEGGDGIPFIATWYVSNLPSELTRCNFIFDGNADLSYEVTILNAEFINYLIDAIAIFKETQCVDFPQGFYRKLLRLEESAS